MSDLPSIASELERKTFDQLERLVRHHEQGKINTAQFATGIQTIYQIVAGLVPEALAIAIESADPEQTDQSFKERRVFWSRSRGDVIVLLRHSDGAKLSITKSSFGERIPKVINYDFSDQTIPSIAASARQKQLANGLTNNSSYVEI